LILLFWAGYDTTASASSWILHNLAQRPDWQDRLREELKDLDTSDIGSLESSRDFPQLNWFLYEIERAFPSALFFPRVAIEDFEYQGHIIPNGTPVFYSPYMTGRDPRMYVNPNIFDPDRWNPEREQAIKPKVSQLVGFGGGPRLCLGKSFAILQLKIQIYSLVTQYRIEPKPAPSKVMGVPVHHPEDSYIRLIPLNR